ncbi:MAG: hypothetical protein ACQEV7_11940 [Bacillota bacterium]
MNSEEKMQELEMLLSQEQSNLTELGIETLHRLKQELQYGAE